MVTDRPPFKQSKLSLTLIMLVCACGARIGRAQAQEALAEQLAAEQVGVDTADASKMADDRMRTWHDSTARYQVQAELVAADASKAVLRDREGQLLVMQLDQLSKSDRVFVEQWLQDERSTAATHAESPAVESPAEVQDASGDRKGQGARAQGARAMDSVWKLTDGDVVKGRLLGFGQEDLVLVRRDADVFVNGTPFGELAPAYQKTVPLVVSKIDGVEVGDREALEDHLADGGGGPFEYTVVGIQVNTPKGGLVTIPLELLRPADREAVLPGMTRWLAAQQDDVAAEVREETNATERLLLESHQRLGQPSMSSASSASVAATASASQGAAAPGVVTPRVSPVRMMDLQLQAATAGVTDIWQVLLYPANAYGVPRTIVVPAQNSRGATVAATARYPGWRVGPVRKLSY